MLSNMAQSPAVVVRSSCHGKYIDVALYVNVKAQSKIKNMIVPAFTFQKLEMFVDPVMCTVFQFAVERSVVDALAMLVLSFCLKRPPISNGFITRLGMLDVATPDATSYNGT